MNPRDTVRSKNPQLWNRLAAGVALLGLACSGYSARAADKEKIVWKPLTAVILRIDDRAPKLWNVYKPDKKEFLLVQLGERFLMLDVKEQQIYELDPKKLGHKGKELIWNEADRPAEPLPTEDWLVREVGPARRIRVKLSGEGRVLNIEVVLAPDERTRRY